MPVSGATLIRIILAIPKAATAAPTVVGVDDWAWRKGHHYGTLLVDLEKHRVLDLLPDRTAATLATWLKARPSIQVLTRDRSTEYAAGMHAGVPGALQVANRWHLLRNVSQMTERLHAHLEHRAEPSPISARTPDASERPRFARSSGEERQRRQRQHRRERRRQLVHYLHHKGLSMRKIARTLGISRTTVARYVHDEAPKSRKRRRSMLDPYLAYLKTRWRQGCQNAHALWREIKERGYPGSPRQVIRWARARRTTPAPSTPQKYREQMVLYEHDDLPGNDDLTNEQVGQAPCRAGVLLPERRAFAKLLTSKPDTLADEELARLKYVCQDSLVEKAYGLVQS
ncbi:MAG: hypothetical protein RhofKO_08500 [Rhodothermales bacterium]